VILPDANLLIYAVDRDSPHHNAAQIWLQSALSGGDGIRLPWVVILAFLRLTTKKGVHVRPLTMEAAYSTVDGWLDHPSVSIAHPGPEHARILRRLLKESGATGDLTTDAHLAALAIEYDAELYSSDRDFARFPGLRWKNPLKRPLQ
jgi:toxin-antitoxin system PIN domain toxin